MSAPIALGATTGSVILPLTCSLSIFVLAVVPVGVWAKASISPVCELTREAGEAQPVGIADRRHRRLCGDQDLGGHLRQQRIGAGEIMGLSRDQQEAQRIAERVGQGMDFGAQSALATADRLIIVFFWVRRRCAGGRARWYCQASHSLSGSAARGSKRRCHTPLLAQR